MPELILLIDDDKSLCRVTEYNLSSAGFRVVTANSGKDGLESFKKVSPDLVVTDVKLGDLSGLDVLEQVKLNSSDTPVIIITAFGSIELAVQAMHKGAFNFITKPFDRDTLILSCKKALELKGLKSRNLLLSNQVDKLTGTHGIVAASSVMRELVETATRAAGSEATILITGESGTGKEMLARLIHRNSPRQDGPMVTVNCAAIPPGLIESELFGHVKGAFTGAVKDRKGHFLTALGGTLFLDEIGELAIDIQAKLLRVIQEREVQQVGSDLSRKIDIRIIAATNLDLKDKLAENKFREDLFYRLSVIPLFIPPLRERPADIPALVKHFLKKFDAPPEVRFSDSAMEMLKSYQWPGNIREMQNTIERCIILRKNPVIEPADLSLFERGTEAHSFEAVIPEQGIALEDIEKAFIKKAFDMTNGNQSKAARLLKIPRHVLLYRMEKYKIGV